MYEKYGPIKNGNSYTFTVYAPNAAEIKLVVNGTETIDMVKDDKDFVASYPAKHMDTYHYMIDGIEKFDPFARYIQDGLLSTVYESSYSFKNPRNVKQLDNNTNVIEFYLPLVDGDNYIEKGVNIVEKALAGDYTHILLMPLHHHWYVGSLGYQPQGMFAPSWFYGDPDQLKQMIDYIHSNGLSVILDFVIWEFTETPENNGLHKYDGSYIYSRTDKVSPEFGGFYFNLRNTYVKNFLKSSLKFWMEEYKIDGFRLDGMNEFIFVSSSEGPLNQLLLSSVNEIISDLDSIFILEFIENRRAQDVGFLNSIDERDIFPFFLEFFLKNPDDGELKSSFNNILMNGNPYDLTAVNHDFFMRGNTNILEYNDFSAIGRSYIKDNNQEYSDSLMFILKLVHATRNNTIDFGHIELFSENFNAEFKSFRDLLNEIWDENLTITDIPTGYSVKHNDTVIEFNIFTKEVIVK